MSRCSRLNGLVMRTPGSSRISLAAIVVTVVILSTAWTASRHAMRLGTAEAQQAKDVRQRLVLPPAGRDKILAEMRLMLESINGILQGLASRDMAAAERPPGPRAILSDNQPDGKAEALLSFWGEPFMSRTAGRDVPRYVFQVQGHSELVARLSEVERYARMRS